MKILVSSALPQTAAVDYATPRHDHPHCHTAPPPPPPHHRLVDMSYSSNTTKIPPQIRSPPSRLSPAVRVPQRQRCAIHARLDRRHRACNQGQSQGAYRSPVFLFLTETPYHKVLIAAHGNSLRALVKHLDCIADDAIAELSSACLVPCPSLHCITAPSLQLFFACNA